MQSAAPLGSLLPWAAIDLKSRHTHSHAHTHTHTHTHRHSSWRDEECAMAPSHHHLQYRSLSATVGICASLASLYGPNRMLKAFQYTSDQSGLPTGSSIVSDALHVVNALRIDDDPVAFVLRSSLHGHYLSHGNGVTSLAALIGAVGRAAQRLVSRGGHSSRDIASVFRSCATVCCRVCEGTRGGWGQCGQDARALLPGIGVSVVDVLDLADTHRELMVAACGVAPRLTPEALAWSLIHVCLATPVDPEVVNQMAECTGIGGWGGDGTGGPGHGSIAVATGSLVVIHGLASRPELNGRLAQVDAPVGDIAADGRAAVLLLPPESSIGKKSATEHSPSRFKSKRNNSKRLRPKKLSIRFKNLAYVSGDGCAAVLWRRWLQQRVRTFLKPLVQGLAHQRGVVNAETTNMVSHRVLECFSKLVSQIVGMCAQRHTRKQAKTSEQSRERTFRLSLATSLNSAIDSFQKFVSPFAVTKPHVTNYMRGSGSIFSGHVIGVGANSVGAVDCAFRTACADDKSPGFNKQQSRCCSRSLSRLGVLGTSGLVCRAMMITGDIIIDGGHKRQLFVGDRSSTNSAAHDPTRTYFTGSDLLSSGHETELDSYCHKVGSFCQNHGVRCLFFRGTVDETVKWALAEKEGIVVLDSLTWTDADILVRVAGINLSPSCVPLHRSASESGYVSRQLVHLQLSEDFFWTGDGGAPVTANPDQNLTRIDASGGLFGHTAAADERCRLTSHNMVVVVESVARHCDDKSVIFPQMCVPLPAASSSHAFDLVRRFWKHAHRVRNALTRGVVIQGGGAAEVACAASVWQLAKTAYPGRKREICRSFVEAILMVPQTATSADILRCQQAEDCVFGEGHTETKNVASTTSMSEVRFGRHANAKLDKMRAAGAAKVALKLHSLAGRLALICTNALTEPREPCSVDGHATEDPEDLLFDDWGATCERWTRAVRVVDFALHLTPESLIINDTGKQ